MQPERWQRVKRLFEAALERGAEQRSEFLNQACAGDRSLRVEVEALLVSYEQDKGFMESPAVAGAASSLLEEQTPSLIGELFGPYKILREIGRGGMGDVYLAEDIRLGRQVALKLLPTVFTTDQNRLSRFQQEARVASSLSHPNVCVIHGVGETEDGRHYIVMEYVEGQMLSRHMAGARMKLAEVVDVATQIASALAAAHAAGVVHRDIKPDNIMLRQDGIIKVLDFGLAKLTEPEALDLEGSTRQLVETQSGMVQGTIAYMSPEQARGLPVDARTDIWSLGVVLYEMLAGQRPFEGQTPGDMIAAVLTNEPASLAQVVPEVPVGLQRIVRRCMEKQPDKRFQSAGDLAFALEEISLPSGTTAVRYEAPSLLIRLTKGRLSWMLSTGVLLLIALVLTMIHFREQPELKLAAAFTIAAPEGWTAFSPAVSPDGRYIVFSAIPRSAQAGQANALWIRRLDSTEAKMLPGTEGAYVGWAFWSPDSQSVAFWADGRLRRIDISGGPPVTLSDADSSRPGTWNREGTILFHRGLRLGRIAAAGGQAITLNPFAEGETGQGNPRFLPDGKHFLYYSQNRDPQNDGVYVASLEPGESRKLVLRNAVVAMYVSTGYLLFNREAVLMAQRFDLKRLEVTGEPVPVAEPVEAFAGSLVQLPIATFSASESGVLVWNLPTSPVTQLTWFDRSGKRLGTVGEPSEYSGPAFSPAEDRLAVARVDPKTKTRDLWIMNLLHGGSSKLTFEPGDDFNPVWSPDGKWIIYTSTQKGPRNIYRKLADGTGGVEPMLESDDPEHVEDISSDGRFLIFNTRPSGAPRPDIFVLSLTEERKRTAFLSTPFWEDEAQFSPNGRWVAYRSNETDTSEVFVRGFAPDGAASAGQWQVSNKSGWQPRWRADGKELFYLQSNTLMVAAVNTGDGSFSAGTPMPLFNMNILYQGRNSFVVTKDGQRFLVVELLAASGESTIAVKTNWLAELNQ